MVYYWACQQEEIMSLPLPFFSREFVEKTVLATLQLHGCENSRKNSGMWIIGAVNWGVKQQKDEKHSNKHFSQNIYFL